MRVRWSVSEWLLGPFSMLRKVWPSAVMLAVLIAAGTLVFKHYQQGWDWIDAFYGSVNTITTIGLYGTDPKAMPDGEKLWLIVIIMFSVGVAATAVQNIVGLMIRRELWHEELQRLRAKRMENHAVIVGSGNCAREVAKKLAGLGIAYNAVVPETAHAADVAAFEPAPVVRGELRRRATLAEAHAEHAAQIEIAVDDDALALVVTMNARALTKKARIVVNADDEELQHHFTVAGANVVICSSRVIGRAMAVAAVTDHVSGMVFSEIAGMQREIGVFKVAPNSFAAGKKIGESEVHVHAWILGVVRAGTFHWEIGRDSVLHPGDELVVLGDVRSFEQVRQMIEA